MKREKESEDRKLVKKKSSPSRGSFVLWQITEVGFCWKGAGELGVKCSWPHGMLWLVLISMCVCVCICMYFAVRVRVCICDNLFCCLVADKIGEEEKEDSCVTWWQLIIAFLFLKFYVISKYFYSFWLHFLIDETKRVRKWNFSANFRFVRGDGRMDRR